MGFKGIFAALLGVMSSTLWSSGFMNPPGTITRFGAAYEVHQRFSNYYLVFDQEFPTPVYYELRANYIISNLNVDPSTQLGHRVPSSTWAHVSGFGATGIFGYIFPVVPGVRFMPFMRLQNLPQSVAAYRDTSGNEIKSENYVEFLGGKLAMGVNDRFTFYALYFGGFQQTILNGNRVFGTASNARVNSFVSVVEFDFAYMITPRWRMAPYVQHITALNHPDKVANADPFQITHLTTTDLVFALRLEVTL